MFPFLGCPITPHGGYNSQIVADDIDISVVIDRHPFVLPYGMITEHSREFQRCSVQQFSDLNKDIRYLVRRARIMPQMQFAVFKTVGPEFVLPCPFDKAVFPLSASIVRNTADPISLFGDIIIFRKYLPVRIPQNDKDSIRRTLRSHLCCHRRIFGYGSPRAKYRSTRRQVSALQKHFSHNPVKG